ncbi:periplasmic heavy metal sensor [Rhodospirillaceae bacterium KN72]|uniref:Periplasmic heavy metal sensor n=1 Tax=Pacificispira spongiicola TaxID=2729598 RepID=A0A7Y0DZM8_9PROT|nr:periplasmic heavy metal sensor [Pacificispira spongiicola]NMM44501.1 periplasmic heavy metal sensor [Pacificispira spongiicola]
MTMQDTDPKKKPRRSWLLIGSLALNLFLIGFFAIGAIRHHHRGFDDFGGRSHFRTMMHYMEDRGGPHHLPPQLFSDADEVALAEIRNQHGSELAQTRADVRAARNAVRDLMRDGVRDPQRLAEALNDASAARDRYSKAINAMILDLAGSLSDDGYRDLAGPERP